MNFVAVVAPAVYHVQFDDAYLQQSIELLRIQDLKLPSQLMRSRLDLNRKLKAEIVQLHRA
jgi:hypothetical protein